VFGTVPYGIDKLNVTSRQFLYELHEIAFNHTEDSAPTTNVHRKAVLNTVLVRVSSYKHQV